MASKKKLLDLPGDCLISIFKFISPRDVLLISATCKALYEISLSNHVFAQYCHLRCQDIPLYKLYFQIQAPFAPLVGFYHSDYPLFKGKLLLLNFGEAYVSMQELSIKSNAQTRRLAGSNDINVNSLTDVEVISKPILGMQLQNGKFELVCLAQEPIHKAFIKSDFAEQESSKPDLFDNGLWAFRDPFGSDATLAESCGKILEVTCENTCHACPLSTPDGIVGHIPKYSKSKLFISVFAGLSGLIIPFNPTIFDIANISHEAEDYS